MMAEHASKSLNVIYHSGSLDGIVTITQNLSPIHVYIIPRKCLKEAKDLDGIFDQGFYFLINPDEDNQITKIYIGQTRNGLQRIYDHDKKKDWWTKAILVLGDSSTFNLDMISGLEKYGIDKAATSGYEVDNEANPKYVMKTMLFHDVEYIYRETEFLLATQGYSLSKKHHKKVKSKPAPVPVEDGQTQSEPVSKPAEEPSFEEPAPEAPAPDAQPEEETDVQPAGTWVSLDREFNPTGYKIHAFSLAGEEHVTSTFRSLLKDVVQLLYKAHSGIFEAIADGGQPLSGRIKRDDSFTKAEQIPGADIWYETNYSAVDTLRFIHILAEACGVSLSSIRICVSPKSQPAEPVPAAQDAAPHYDASMDGILHISTKDVTALGRYSPETGELTVLEGSQINLSKNNTKGPAKEAREKAVSSGDIQEEGGCNILKKAYTFHTPSAAGMFVMGRSSDGRREWKDAGGTP
ncbi:MAG: GIY-YIG nuclease family protein, partial [Clostridia bacterium]|nr:GIY-YIG nuclease family protein [Clostridia bacterium]